ncbi:MAG: LysR family transcriptional regulator [Polyangiaceae bacterium]|nr:LysR family transcriptional regulator [Polyangiaceae bacterium]
MTATIDVALLAAFVEVADAASFSAAARTLGTTTATVSRSIAKLEDAVGSRLFHRTTRRVSLTSAGTALYERTATHLRALAHAAKELPEHQSEPAGTLKLTAPYDLGATFLGSVIARFIARYPKVHVQAEFSSHAVNLAAEGFDVALRGDSVKHTDTSLTARRLVQRGELNLYASPAYLSRRGSPHGLASPDHEWLVAGPLRRAFHFPATLTPRIVANDFLFLRGVAASGSGIATLPSFIAQPYVTSGDLVRVLPSVSVSVGGLVLLYSSTRPLARKVAAFRDFLVEVIQREWVD